MQDAFLRTKAETVVSAFPPLNRTLKVLWCCAERRSAGPMERTTVTVLGVRETKHEQFLFFCFFSSLSLLKCFNVGFDFSFFLYR